MSLEFASLKAHRPREARESISSTTCIEAAEVAAALAEPDRRIAELEAQVALLRAVGK